MTDVGSNEGDGFTSGVDASFKESRLDIQKPRVFDVVAR